MRIGIDFGTSFSAAAARVDDRIVHVDFAGQPQFRTSVYFPTAMPEPGDFALDAAMEAEVDALVRTSRRKQARAGTTPRTDAQLRAGAVRVVRRQWLEQQMRQAEASAARLQDAVFGEAAIDRYLAEGGGHLMQSPKSMLGYQLHPRAREAITGIAAHILEHVRLTAGQQLGVPVRAATLGRPVCFRSSMGDAGGEQALAILREAATVAGFDEVDFLEEPAAAALHHHAGSRERHSTLVFDVGGGTTDIALADIGGDDAPRVHAAWGVPLGGSDVDLALSLARCMPLLGRGAGRIPAHHFVEAAMVHDAPRQREFQRRDFRDVPAPYGERLQALQAPGGTTRLARGVEAMKVALSGAQHASHDMGDIAPGLRADATRSDLEAAGEDVFGRLDALLGEVAAALPRAPDSLFLTGGMSTTPALQRLAQARFPSARLVLGDPSLGVVAGLAEHAHRA